jgi:membrane-bound lytic murein transglycosylase B
MTINEDKEFEPQVKEPQEEEIKIGQDEQLQVLPENEQEEKEEILLTSSVVEPAKAKTSSSKAKSSRIRRRDVLSSVDVRKMLEKQNTQIHKITVMLQYIQKDTKSTQGQPKLMKRLKSQIKLLQNQLVQIQKIITKKSVATSKSRSRKKVPTLKRAKKKR